MRSRTDYILGTDSRLFQNVAGWDARHNTDHYLVLGCLHRAAPAAHSRYIGRRARFPIRPPSTPDRVDCMFAEPRQSIPRPPWQERHHQAWISPETWSLIVTMIAVQKWKDQQIYRPLNRAIKAMLQEDRRRRTAEAGSAVESLLTFNPPLIREAWIQM